MGLRPPVQDVSDEWLEQRRRDLIGQRQQPDLPEVQPEIVFQHRVDRGQQRLQEVVDQVPGADGDEDSDDGAVM